MSETLDQIKKRLSNAEDCNDVEIKDVKWLIEQAEKAERYEKALKVIAEHTTCDDTWDFTNRLLQGLKTTGLPYRFNIDEGNYDVERSVETND